MVGIGGWYDEQMSCIGLAARGGGKLAADTEGSVALETVGTATSLTHRGRGYNYPHVVREPLEEELTEKRYISYPRTVSQQVLHSLKELHWLTVA